MTAKRFQKIGWSPRSTSCIDGTYCDFILIGTRFSNKLRTSDSKTKCSTHRKTRNIFVVMWQCVRNCMCFVKHHLFRKSCGLGSRCLQWCMAFISVVSTLSAAKLPRHPIDLLGSNIRNPGAVRVWSTVEVYFFRSIRYFRKIKYCWMGCMNENCSEFWTVSSI